jgi:hypothetical protein
VDGHMAAQSHHHHHRCFQRFRRIGWNEILGDVSVQTMPLHYGWGLYILSNCIPYPHPTYKKVFEHLHLLWMGRLLHTHTVITTDISKDSGEWCTISATRWCNFLKWW